MTPLLWIWCLLTPVVWVVGGAACWDGKDETHGASICITTVMAVPAWWSLYWAIRALQGGV